jgi:hypothetical protein
MGKRVTEDTLASDLVHLAVPFLQEAEGLVPRSGPGAKPTIAEWVVAALIMIALLHKKKTKSAQFRFLQAQRRQIVDCLGCSQFPSRATYFRRYRQCHRLYQEAIRLQGQAAIGEGIVDPQHVVVDKSLIEALGPPWHVRQQRAKKCPAGVDVEATWGYSEHDDWVYGFSFEVVVSATPGSVVFPLLASVDSASTSEMRTFTAKIDALPEGTQTVSADSAYDANHLGEKVEYDEQGQRTGRRFLCPENPRHSGRTKTKPCAADASRAQSRARRGERKKYLKNRQGRRIYRRRSKTVEPFNQWFKSLFELEGRVWHRGLANNRTQILGSLFVYQLLVRYNHHCGNQNARIRWVLDAL